MTQGGNGLRAPKIAAQVLLFDAVGTLIHPQPAAAEVYGRVGRAYGSRLTPAQVQQRFWAALEADRRRSENADWMTSPQAERDRWREIVTRVFTDVPSAADPIFRTLWQHFARPQSWQLDPDVPRLWARLAAGGFRLGIASNFDERLEVVCRQVPTLAEAEFVFHSGGLGARKPGLAFFRHIEDQLNVPRDALLLVGDDLVADYEGAMAAGWQAVWLDRDGRADSFHRSITRLSQLARQLSG